MLISKKYMLNDKMYKKNTYKYNHKLLKRNID
jgi:hypothetical protein